MLVSPSGISLPHLPRAAHPCWRVLWLAVSLMPLALFVAAMLSPEPDPGCVWLCPEILSCVESIRAR